MEKLNVNFNELVKVQGEVIKQATKGDNDIYKYHITLLKSFIGYALLITLESHNDISLYSFETGLSKEDALKKYNYEIGLDY